MGSCAPASSRAHSVQSAPAAPSASVRTVQVLSVAICVCLLPFYGQIAFADLITCERRMGKLSLTRELDNISTAENQPRREKKNKRKKENNFMYFLFYCYCCSWKMKWRCIKPQAIRAKLQIVASMWALSATTTTYISSCTQLRLLLLLCCF